MYTSANFKNKTELKNAVKEGRQIRVFSPGIGTPPVNGVTWVEGPHYRAHTWYAEVTLKDGVIVKVK